MHFLPRHITQNLLQRRFRIRCATDADIAACDHIARQYPHELAFVRKASLQRGVDNQSLHVAALPDYGVVGFALFHRRRDGWQTVYDLAVDRRFAGLSIGRNLLYSVPCPIRLKVTSDNTRANRFYQQAGMSLASTESGRNRTLNVYEMRVLKILCRGSKAYIPRVAQATGWATGKRHNHYSYAWQFFIDIDWQNYDWTRYLKIIQLHMPAMAMVNDWTDDVPLRTVLHRIQQLREIGVLHVMVCPKDGNDARFLPDDVIIGVSVPTKQNGKYAGDAPDLRTVAGRRVHLLGGSPKMQMALHRQIQSHGAEVISLDTAYHVQKAEMFGASFDGTRWIDRQGKPNAALAIESGRQLAQWYEAQMQAPKQLKLAI